MITKQDLLTILRKEFSTTLKAMRAFPADKLDTKPHERSQSAGKIMSTFVFEMFLIENYAYGKNIDRSLFQTYAPDRLQTLEDDFEKESSLILKTLESLNEDELGKKLKFAGKEFSAADFILMMLFDQIHHRGQLSVYIRIAGGKVPSIYGPSADDPSTNF